MGTGDPAPATSPIPGHPANRSRVLDGVSSALVLRPGDTLVVAFNRRLTLAELDELREQIETELPGIKGAIFDDAAQIAAYRPESADA